MLEVTAPEENRLEVGIIFQVLTTTKTAASNNEDGLQQTMKYPVDIRTG